MARALHDTLGQLGYDKLLEKTVSALPDAKDRLAYVANLTEQAACRVLNATDIASPLVDEIENGSKALGARWDKVFANQLGPEEFKKLAAETRDFLNRQLPQKTQATHAQLTEIMMAQDFQDLTGQVIKKVVSLAQDLESGLMNVLVEVMPETKRTEEVASLMNGPVINSEGRTDIVVNQEQVDDLLDSLGF
jgi:chemotaxis protein CheZ